MTLAQPAQPPVALPEYALTATGSMRLVLVINLSSFVHSDDADTFRHMRGSEAFAEVLRTLQPAPPFGVDEATAVVERDAYALRVFRSRLRHNHFFPTFRMAWDETTRALLQEAETATSQRWTRWTCRVRLTRNGLAVVMLEQSIDQMPLVACTEQVLELPSHGQPGTQDQWALGMLVLKGFLKALGGSITVRQGERIYPIRFTTDMQLQHTIRLDRFVIYAFRRIELDHVLVAPETIKREYAATIASFMEGALVECDGERRYPRYAANQAAALLDGDVASWDEELCLFTGESALLYFPLIGRGLAYVGGPMGLTAHAYSSYWAGIIRGIEHLLAFRAEAQQLERRTTDLLSRVPALTRKVNHGQISANDVAVIDHLAASLSDIFDSLPELRSMAVLTNAFRADYVRRKFEVLQRELLITDTLALVNQNVEELDFFLSYANDMRLQWQGQRTNSLGLALGAIVLFMAVSSFLADTFNVVDRLNEQDGWTILTWIAVAALGLGLMAVTLIRLKRVWFRPRRRSHSAPPR